MAEVQKVPCTVWCSSGKKSFAIWRAHEDSMHRVIPLNIRPTPTKVPITTSVFAGQVRQMRTPRIIIMMPSNTIQPTPGSGRMFPSLFPLSEFDLP